MALLAFSTAAWAILNGLTSYVDPSATVTLFLKVLFVSGAVIVTSLVHLAILFPYKTFTFDKLHAVLLYFPAFILSLVAIFTSTIFSGYNVNSNIAGWPIPGPMFGVYQLVVSAFYFASVVLLFYKQRVVGGFQKNNARIFLLGVVLGGLPAISLNLWAVFYEISVNPLISVVFSVFWVGSTTYIILKK